MNSQQSQPQNNNQSSQQQNPPQPQEQTQESENSRRMVSKGFSCPICNKKFKKLVQVSEMFAKCPFCGHEHCTESIAELSRENVDRTYRINFQEVPPQVASQYHPNTDLFDRSQSNFYGDARRLPQRAQQPQGSQTQRQQQGPQQRQQPPRPVNDNLLYLFIPFSVSPFAGSVRRSPFTFAVFSSPFNDQYFESPTEDFFMDNFASNFTSNFFNPMARIVFTNTMNDQNQHMGSPPASKKSKMAKEYCKKDEKDPSKFEHPTCSVCLMDIQDGEDTILVPCGHMFHEGCITQWLNIHNSCPVCRFELPTDDAEYEMERNQRNMQRNVNISRNRNVRTVDLQNPGNSQPQQSNPPPQRQESNINMMGESDNIL